MSEEDEDAAFFDRLSAQYRTDDMEGLARCLSARLRQIDKRARAANARADRAAAELRRLTEISFSRPVTRGDIFGYVSEQDRALDTKRKPI